jgi:ribonuclease J
MNIITNKDIFSEENRPKLGRTAEKRRGKARKPSLGIPVSRLSNTSPLPTGNDAPRPISARPVPLQDTPISAPAAPKKTVFYQAARPKQRPPQAGPNAPVPGPRPSLPPRAPMRPNLPSMPPRPALAGPTGPGMRSHLLNQPQPRPVLRPLPTPPSGGNRPELKVRIIPLGGLEEIGKNMTVFEYGDDIIVIDMGFLFPDSEMLGVDYIIPDVAYLDNKRDHIRGAIMTHGHLDHIGGVPYLVERLGFPTMYGTPITMGMVKHRLEEFNLLGRNKIVTIEPEKDVLQLGAFRVRPFRLIHSVPGAIGLEIETPNGRIVYATDWKFDYTPASGEPVDFRTLAAIGARGVDLLFSDSTNADRPGHSISEKTVETTILNAVEEAPGRVIIAMFASDINRMQMAFNAAAKTNRKVVVSGRSMQNNLTMAVDLKAFHLPPHTLISDREFNRFNDNQILVLATGAQGEERAALSRMAKGEHRTIKIKKGDTVIISASPIPGNERSVQSVMEQLYKAGANVIYNKILDVHTSGHAYQEDLKLMAALMRPRWFMPLHGERSRRILHGKLVQETGIRAEKILIANNGSVLEMNNAGDVSITEEQVPAGYVIVDGLGVGDIGEVVLRDRQSMAHDGIFVIISVFDSKKKQFVTSPDIISRGFIYMRENEKFVSEIRNEIKAFLANGIKGGKVDLGSLRSELRDHISKLLYQKTEREPIVIPVIIEL